MSDFKGIGDWHHKAKAAEGDYEPPDISLYDDVDLDSIEPEEKSVVRHVRTPEGVIKYDQPIGSVIVRDPLHLSAPHAGSDIHPMTATPKKAVPYIKPATKKPFKKKATKKGTGPYGAGPLVNLHYTSSGEFEDNQGHRFRFQTTANGYQSQVWAEDFSEWQDWGNSHETILKAIQDLDDTLSVSPFGLPVPAKKAAVKKSLISDKYFTNDNGVIYRVTKIDGKWYVQVKAGDDDWTVGISGSFHTRQGAVTQLHLMQKTLVELTGPNESAAQVIDPTTRWNRSGVPVDELGILRYGFVIEQINTANVAGEDRVLQVHLLDQHGGKWILERSSVPSEWRLFDSKNDLVSRDKLSVLFDYMAGQQALEVPIKLRYMKFVEHDYDRDTYAPINAKDTKRYGPGSIEIERTRWSTGGKYLVTTYETRVPFETAKEAFLFADLYTGVNHGDMNIAELNKAKKALARLTGFKSKKYELFYDSTTNTAHINVKNGDTTTIVTVRKALSNELPYAVSLGGYTYQGETVDEALDKAMKFATTPPLNTAVTPEDLDALRAQGFARITFYDNYRQTWRAPNHTKISLYIDQEGRYTAMSYATDEVVTAETPRAALETLYKGEMAAQEAVQAKIRSLSRVGKDAALTEDKTTVSRSTIVGFIPRQNDFDGKMFIQKGFEDFKKKDDWGLGLVTIEGPQYGERRIPRQEYAQKLLEALTPEERSNLEKLLNKIVARWGLVPEKRIEEQEGWSADEKHAAQLLQYGHDAWADSASNPFAVKVQTRVAKMFGTNPYLDHIKWSIEEAQRRERESGWTEVDDDTLDALVRTVYEATQNELLKRGVDTMRLARGMSVNSGIHGVEDTNQQALASYSTDEERAREFGTPMYVEVPRERIFSVSWLTGMGSAYEDEVVVIGNNNDQAFFNLGKERTW